MNRTRRSALQHLLAARRPVLLRALGLAGLLALRAAAPQAAEELIDGIAAQVGGEIVLVSEIHEMAAPVEQRMRDANAPQEQIEAMRSQVLERLIENQLIGGLVRRMELSATNEEIDRAIEGIAADTGLTMRQLTESVASHGLSYEDYRAKIAGEIERSKVLNTLVRSQVSIDESEIKELYEQRYAKQRSSGEEIHLYHLVVAYGAGVMRDKDTACKLAAEGAQRISSGSFTFEQVARRISDSDPQAGGDMGWVHMEDLAGWMATEVKLLEPKQLSDVIVTGFGCNLLLVDEHREFQRVTFEAARPELESELFQTKMEIRYVEWLEELRKQTYVERKGVFATADSTGFN